MAKPIEPEAVAPDEPDAEELRRALAKTGHELVLARGREKTLETDLREAQEDARKLRAAIKPGARVMIDEDGAAMPALPLGAEDFDFADPRIERAARELQVGAVGRLVVLGVLFRLIAHQAREGGGPITVRAIDEMLPMSTGPDGTPRTGSKALAVAGLLRREERGSDGDTRRWADLLIGPWRVR